MSWRVSPFLDEEFPPLDCHAHVAPDVAAEQIQALDGAQVFAVTRSLSEAEAITAEHGDLVWGCGVHPRDRAARADYDPERFRALLDRFVLVGEVGLDRGGGQIARQRDIFASILDVAEDRPVLLTIHSYGAVGDVLDALAACTPRGPILHWFLGHPADVERAVGLGAYFSINAAMPIDQFVRLPMGRVLPETDFPTKRAKARKPGDVRAIESMLAEIWDLPLEEVRAQLYRNLRELAMRADCLGRLPEGLADLLVSA
jgi:TatD DNase family protein